MAIAPKLRRITELSERGFEGMFPGGRVMHYDALLDTLRAHLGLR